MRPRSFCVVDWAFFRLELGRFSGLHAPGFGLQSWKARLLDWAVRFASQSVSSFCRVPRVWCSMKCETTCREAYNNKSTLWPRNRSLKP